MLHTLLFLFLDFFLKIARTNMAAFLTWPKTHARWRFITWTTEPQLLAVTVYITQCK